MHKSLGLYECKVNVESDDIDVKFVSVYKNQRKYIICGAHIPPKSPLDKYQEVGLCIEDINTIYPKHPLFIIGDFNSPKISWVFDDLGSTYFFEEGAKATVKSVASIMSSFSCNCNLFQKANLFNSKDFNSSRYLDNYPLYRISYLGNEFIKRNVDLDFNETLSLNQYSLNMIIK